MEATKISNVETIAYGLEQGKDNGGISCEALALFLRGVVTAIKADQQFLLTLKKFIYNIAALEDLDFACITAKDWSEAKHIDKQITELLALIEEKVDRSK